jgi:hypothetical protein
MMVVKKVLEIRVIEYFDMRYTGLSRGIAMQVHLTLGSHIGSTRWQTSILEVLTAKAINVITRHKSALVTGFLYTFSYTIVCRKNKLTTKLYSVAWFIGPLASFQPEPSLFSSGEKDNYSWL